MCGWRAGECVNTDLELHRNAPPLKHNSKVHTEQYPVVNGCPFSPFPLPSPCVLPTRTHHVPAQYITDFETGRENGSGGLVQNKNLREERGEGRRGEG